MISFVCLQRRKPQKVYTRWSCTPKILALNRYSIAPCCSKPMLLSHMLIAQVVLTSCMCCYIVCLLLYQLSQYCNVISATRFYTVQASSVQPSATGHWSKSHFPCIACHKLLYNPVVLNCGHAVCNATCRPVAASPEDPVCPGCDAPSVKTPAVCTQVRCLLLLHI